MTAASSAPPLLLTATPGGVLRLILNRPTARNALSSDLMAALKSALDSAAADNATGTSSNVMNGLLAPPVKYNAQPSNRMSNATWPNASASLTGLALRTRMNATGAAKSSAAIPAARGANGKAIRSQPMATAMANAWPVAAQGRSHAMVVTSARASKGNDFVAR